MKHIQSRERAICATHATHSRTGGQYQAHMAQVLAGLAKTTLDMIPAYAKQTAQRLQNSLFARDRDEYEP